MVENLIIFKMLFADVVHLTFVSSMLSVIFQSKVTAICLKFLFVFS